MASMGNIPQKAGDPPPPPAGEWVCTVCHFEVQCPGDIEFHRADGPICTACYRRLTDTYRLPDKKLVRQVEAVLAEIK